MLDALWERVLTVWEEDRTHAAFLEQARAAKALAEAASRYRQEAERADKAGETTRAESARKRLGGVATLAMLELDASHTPRDRAAGRAAKIISWVATAILFVLTWFAVTRFVLR
jgi:hypothetical protein